MKLTASVDKRRSVLINVAYYALILGAFYLFMRFAFWPLSPFLFAFFIAMLLQKPVRFLTKKTSMSKGVASLFIILLLVIAVLGTMILAGTTIVNEVKGLIQLAMSYFENLPDFINKSEAWILGVLEKLPDAVYNPIASSVNDLADKLIASFSENEAEQAAQGFKLNLSGLITPITGVISTASKLPSILIAIVIGFIACCFMTIDYERITGFIKRQLPKEKAKALGKTKALTISTMSKMLKAYFLIVCITCAELVIGLNALKLLGLYDGGYVFLISLGVAIVDILPVLGSGTILIPWGIISLFMGNVGLGVGIIIIYAIISVLRQFIEPRLVAGQLGLPPIATLMGMYIGLKLFGVLGMFILPFTITILKVLNDDGVIHIWRSAHENDTPGQSSIELKKLAPITIKRKKK